MKRKLQLLVVLVAALSWWTAHAAEPLGRLFFTPTQRSALDAGKQVRTQRSSRAPAVRGPREVTLNGIVTRSDGESTVWVNGRALDARPASGLNATSSRSDPAAARVTVSGARNAVRMRVGQRLEPGTGKIAEPYQAVTSRLDATPIAKREDTVTPPVRASKSKDLENETRVIEDKNRDAPTVAR